MSTCRGSCGCSSTWRTCWARRTTPPRTATTTSSPAPLAPCGCRWSPRRSRRLTCHPNHLVELGVGRLAQHPPGDVLAEHRAVLEGVPRSTAGNQDVVVLRMAVDDEVFVG